MQIELKHLAPYLPYKLKVTFESDDEYQHSLIGLDITRYGGKLISPFEDYGTCEIERVRPILRPLSDLTKEIEHNRESFVPVEWFEIGDDSNESLEYDFVNIKIIEKLEVIAVHKIHRELSFIPYGVVQKLFEWHFDVFGLIDKGLAVDINTLEL